MKPANLDMEQLERLKRLERELGCVLVAYQTQKEKAKSM